MCHHIMKAKIHKDHIRKKILKKGIVGLIAFSNALAQELRFVDEEQNVFSLPQIQIDFGHIPTFISPKKKSPSPVELEFADESLIRRAAVQFMETLFESATEGKKGGIWYRPKFATLQDYAEDQRRKHFHEVASPVNASFDAIDIYWSAMFCRAIMGMIENGQVHPFFKTETIRTESTEKELERVFSEDIAFAYDLPGRINCLNDKREIIHKAKTKYRFEPLNQYAGVISQIHFFIAESGHKLDPEKELKSFIQECQRYNPEIFTKKFYIEDFFNLEHAGIVPMMIQLFATYAIENETIERIQFCRNHFYPEIYCDNLMFEKKQGKDFCGDYCRKIHNAKIRQSEDEQKKNACRKRQYSILKQRTDLISRHFLIDMPQPSSVWKEDCKRCTDYLKGLKGGQCRIAQEKNQILFEKYREYKEDKST